MAKKLMRAALLFEYGKIDKFQVQEIPYPVAGRGQVIVKVEASPINPSDLGFIQGKYAFKRPLPAVPGNECSGLVVFDANSGSGSIEGKRVSCVTEPTAQGAWAQYTLANAQNCVMLPADVSYQQGACFFINPLTARMFWEVIRQEGPKAVIQTAAASALGKMLNRVCQQHSVPVINIVRRKEQIDILKAMGYQYVINSADPDFPSQLSGLSSTLNATIAFDAVSGPLAGVVFSSLCDSGTLFIYGSLSSSPASGLDPGQFIYKNKRVAGLFLSAWLKQLSLDSRERIVGETLGLLQTTYKSDISKEFTLQQVTTALEYYQANMSAGKVLIRPNLL